MFTPVSNFPVYWFAWRAWMCRRGAQGGYALRELLLEDAPSEGSSDTTATASSSSSSSGGDGSDSGGSDGGSGGSGGGSGGSGGDEGAKDYSTWVDYSKECTRMSGGTDDDGEGDTVCCRVRRGALYNGGDGGNGGASASGPPAVLFVPCAVLDAADARVLRAEGEEGGESFKSFNPESVAEVETLLGASGVTELARRYHRLPSSSS
jgi:hypothetical protein